MDRIQTMLSTLKNARIQGNRLELFAERQVLLDQLEALPDSAFTTRVSIESRIAELTNQLRELNDNPS